MSNHVPEEGGVPVDYHASVSISALFDAVNGSRPWSHFLAVKAVVRIQPQMFLVYIFDNIFSTALVFPRHRGVS